MPGMLQWALGCSSTTCPSTRRPSAGQASGGTCWRCWAMRSCARWVSSRWGPGDASWLPFKHPRWQSRRPLTVCRQCGDAGALAYAWPLLAAHRLLRRRFLACLIDFRGSGTLVQRLSMQCAQAAKDGQCHGCPGKTAMQVSWLPRWHWWAVSQPEKHETLQSLLCSQHCHGDTP